MSDFFSGSQMDMPQAPDYSKAMSDMLGAWIGQQGNIYNSEAQWLPKLNDLYNSEYGKSMGAYNSAYQQEVMKGLMNYAPQYAMQMLNYSKEFDPQFIAQSQANARAADPTYWATRDKYGEQVLSDLELGNKLSEAQTRDVQQNWRASSAARGGSQYGYAPAAQEVLGQFLAGEGMKAQRQGNAQNFMSGGAFAPQTGQANTGVTGNSFNTMTNYMTQSGQNMANTGVNAAQNQYNQQMGWAQNYNQNQVSPFAAITGAIGNLAGVGMAGGKNGFNWW